MTRGLMKTASGIAIAAAAGLFATSAMAADLGVGGNCCADLEERVAELEATTARKGNRVVSLTVYGRLTHGLLWHDDEDGYREGKLTARDDGGSPTMFGFRGEASIRPGLTAGYNFEFGVSADDGTDGVSIRHNYVYLDSETVGRVSLGHTSQATDSLYEINLANTVVVPGAQNEESAFLNPALTSPWAGWNYDGERRQGVYYRSPTLAGFVFSAGYSHGSASFSPGGETSYPLHDDDHDDVVGGNPGDPDHAAVISNPVVDNTDYWEAALRYAGEFNGVRVAAGIGYRHEDYGAGDEIDVWLGSGSIMHMPTGLFLSGGYAHADHDGADAEGFWVMAGIEKNFFGPGTTTLFAEYSESDREEWDDGKGKFWGLGVVQRIDAAATDLFVKYRHVSTNVDILDENDDPLGLQDDANVVIGGMRIQF